VVACQNTIGLRLGLLDTLGSRRTHLQCRGNQFLGTDQNPLAHTVVLREHSGCRRVHEEIIGCLTINVMCCAVSQQAPDEAITEIKLVGKILNWSSLRREVLGNAQANN
jgi:hypothetical protein